MLPLPTKHGLGGQIPQVSVPEVSEPQVRHGRSDRLQQVEIAAEIDVGVVGAEQMLDGMNVSPLVLQHVAATKRPEQRGLNRQATISSY